MSKIALIGGSGFIGSVLARQLTAQGHEIRILDRLPSPSYPAQTRIVDVTDRQALIDALEGVDIIYNLAAEHRDDVRPVQKYYDVNVGGAENTVAAAEHHETKTIIFTSTVAVYGLNADPVNGATEETQPAPFNDYGRSKLQAEDVFKNWLQAAPEERRLTMVRLVATFGPENRGNIHTLMNQIHKGRFVMVGRGDNRKSIAYVENVAAFLAYALGFGAGLHVYNYADKPDLETKALVFSIRSAFGMQGMGPTLPYAVGLVGGLGLDVLSRVTGKRFPISAVRVRKFCADTVVNADHVRSTDFVPPYMLEEGLRAMITHDFPVQNKAAA